MLPICSAAPYSPSFHQLISHVGSRMLYPLRKVSEDRFINENQCFYVPDGNHVKDMYFKAKSTKFIYSDVMETPDLATFQDPSTSSRYQDGFDNIVRGFSNEYVDKEHGSWIFSASDINSSCHDFEDFKYIGDSDVLGSYMQNHALDNVSVNGINPGSTSLEALTSQIIDPSIVADSKIEFAKFSDFPNQNMIGLSTVASDQTTLVSDASPLTIPDTMEVVFKESSYIQENVGSFFYGIEKSVNSLLDKADTSVTMTFNTWKLSLSEGLNVVIKTYDNIVNSLSFSIDNSQGQSSKQLTEFSIKLENDLLKEGYIVVDILRWTVISIEDAISNIVTFIVGNYGFAKTFLPQDIRNFLNKFDDEVTRSVSPIGDTLHQVYKAVKEFERNLGLDPNDPLVPLLLVVGTTSVVGISYWFFRYDAYSLSPERTSELLKNDKNVVLVDVRPEAIRKRDGIPDLRREARSKYASVDLLEIDNTVRKQLKWGKEVDISLTAVVIQNLNKIKKGTMIIIMDSDTGISKHIARSLKNLGVKESYVVEGGFQRWTSTGLRFKKSKPETAFTLLNEEVEAILEVIKPSPVQIIGYGLGALVGIYALLEWEKTLQIVGIFCIGQTLYRRFASYEDSEDLRRDVRLLLTPATLGVNAIFWITGKLEPKRVGLPTTPSTTAVQDRVLQAAAKHESQPSDAEDNEGQSRELSVQVNTKKLDLP